MWAKQLSREFCFAFEQFTVILFKHRVGVFFPLCWSIKSYKIHPKKTLAYSNHFLPNLDSLVLNFPACSARCPDTLSSLPGPFVIAVGVIKILPGGCVASKAALSDNVGLSHAPSGYVKYHVACWKRSLNADTKLAQMSGAFDGVCWWHKAGRCSQQRRTDMWYRRDCMVL